MLRLSWIIRMKDFGGILLRRSDARDEQGRVVRFNGVAIATLPLLDEGRKRRVASEWLETILR